MQAILSIEPNEVDEKLLTVIKELLSKNIEVTIKKAGVELKEFDTSIPLEQLIREFTGAGYSEEFVADLKAGFEASEIYK